MEVIKNQGCQTKGLHETIFKATEKEEVEVESKKREVARGRATVEKLPRTPYGRFPKGGRNVTDHISLQEIRVLKRLARHAGLPAKDLKLKLVSEKGMSEASASSSRI